MIFVYVCDCGHAFGIDDNTLMNLLCLGHVSVLSVALSQQHGMHNAGHVQSLIHVHTVKYMYVTTNV